MMGVMPRVIWYGLAILIGLAGASVYLAEGAVHIWKRDAAETAAANAIAKQGAASWKAVQTAGRDGAQLSAWLLTPREPNGGAVILMHGVGDTRMGMSGHAPFLLRAGYTVLMPDSRGHGMSGGDIITYGLREAEDVHRWAGLVLAEPGIGRLYGLGQSMGASILIQSLARENRFRALVADCPFATFDEIAHDRMSQNGIPAWPLVPLGFVYARARYGVQLTQASPVEALRAGRTPVLLIHGTADTNIPPRHSRELHAANPAFTELWEVPGAGHVASLGTQPAEYRQRVLAWFQTR